MTTLQKEKNELLKWIEGLEDPQILDDLRSVKENEKEMHWNDLPKEVQEGIEKGREDARKGRVSPHPEAQKIILRFRK